jgi:membrane protease YdiL (CAAX protease family)
MTALDADPMALEDRITGIRQRPVWGFWPTVGFTVLIMFAIGGAQLVVATHFMLAEGIDPESADIMSLISNGFLVSVATLVSLPIAVGFAFLFVKLRRTVSIVDYFGLRRPQGEELLKWIMLAVLVAVVFDGLAFVVGRQLVTDFVKQAYLTAGSMPLLWVAFVILAPLQEELVFRGFMFKGIEVSRLGAAGAIVVSSLAWALLHVQYDVALIAATFVLGIIIGVARYKTGSLYICIAMHAVWNLAAVVQVELYYRMLAG